MPPPLRRTSAVQRASDAGGLGTDLAIELPQDVHRAHQPMLDQRTELQAPPVTEHVRPTEERDVVVVNDVVGLAMEPSTKRGTLEPGASGLLNRQQAQRAQRRLDGAYPHIGPSA